MTLATVEEFEARANMTLSDSEQTQVQQALEDATDLILDLAEAAAPDDPWVLDPDGVDAPRGLGRVCHDITYRAVTNPDALSQASTADTSVSYVRGQTPDALFATEQDERRIRRAVKGSSFRSLTLVTPWSGDGEDVLL